ncbi:ArsR/SmtB family transcription factor [Nonomuraea jabiensis]|uniref:ArsR/SmtB family transcription factor n=1 Tax=Nonomuraea jabiensis TaxID=882448 RepID=UPI00369F7CD3
MLDLTIRVHQGPGLLICWRLPATAGSQVPSVAELQRRLEAVAHQGRLEVALAIATEPRTAGEIATLWNMDPTQVNRHLRALAATGLARTTRQGRFLRYQLNAAFNRTYCERACSGRLRDGVPVPLTEADICRAYQLELRECGEPWGLNPFELR